MKHLNKLSCEDLLIKIDNELLDIVKNLDEDDWDKKTIYPNWKVKDVFSHIIDTSIRKLSSQRDHYFYKYDTSVIKSYNDLVVYIEKLADSWADVTRRISPRILITIFSIIKDELYDYIKSVDPNGQALFSVAWAGEEVSENWFDNAREFTEHWIHQQEIRDALNLTPLNRPEVILPIMETFIRSIPVAYNKKEVDGKLQIITNGVVDKKYCLEKINGKYEIFEGVIEKATSIITVDCFMFCKMLARIIDIEDFNYEIEGDLSFGRILLESIALMA